MIWPLVTVELPALVDGIDDFPWFHPPFALPPDLAGAPVSIPSTSHRLVHLQFRRFAGCPICNLHLRSIAVRHDELVATS
jgi:hypothetical protein